MSVAKEESKKKRPENMEDTIRMAGLSGIVQHSAGKPKSIKPIASKQSQVMKPGTEIQKLISEDLNEPIGVKTNTMVSRGLLIEECPSKGINMEADSDIEEVPCPEDDTSGDEEARMKGR